MADVITRLKLETTQYDSKLRDASQELSEFGRDAIRAGKDFQKFSKEQIASARAFGTVATSATNVKDKVKELVSAYNQAARAYNNLTKDQQQSDWAKALAGSMAQLKNRIREAKQEMQDFNRETKKSGGGFGARLGSKIGGSLQVAGGMMLANVANNVVEEMKEITSQSIELARAGEGIRIAFERINRPDLLDKLREATHNTVTDIELMKQAVKFKDFRLNLDEMGTLLAFAQQKAKDTGQSVDYMVDSIVTGLGRQSLMILDNLGLSASEIKERMKETGDMTKAVAAIIQDQMSKAGDYMETAADRAAQADTKLQNAMEELGRTFMPIAEAGESMFTRLKIAAINAINGMRPFFDMFTEAGRIRSQYESENRGSQVNNMLGMLKISGNRQSVYNRQVANFDRQISAYQQYLGNYNTWEESKRKGSPDVGAYDRMQAFRKNHSLSDFSYSNVKEHLEIFKRQRAEYVKGAKNILEGQPAPSPATPTTPTGNKVVPMTTIAGLGGLQGVSVGYPAQATFGASAPSSSMLQYLMMSPQELWAKMFGSVSSTGAINGEMWDIFKMRTSEDGKKGLNGEEFKKGFDDAVGGIGSIASGIQQMGIELPEEIQKGLSVLQGISSIMSGIAALVALIQVDTKITAVATTTDAAIPLLAHGGVIRAASGVTVPGTHLSGDMVPALLNSGEVVLNRAQAGVLAAGLTSAGQQTVSQPFVDGERIYLGMNNSLRRRGQGEIVTTSMLQKLGIM